MDSNTQTQALLLEHCARYPAAQPQDLLKFLFQSAYGCEHLLSDPEAAARYIHQEAENPLREGPLIEPLDGPFCRVHLRYLQKGLSEATFARLFVLSGETLPEAAALLEQKLAVLQRLAAEGALPWTGAEVALAVESWRRAGFPPCHHSERFRAAYAPAYRLMRRDFAQYLPLFTAIDQCLPRRERLLLAIEGGSASGKTTLAALLQRVYGGPVFHMDDFFLRPQQRTPQRYAEPGGNVDRERFWMEVLGPLTRGETVDYRRLDCRDFSLGPARQISPGRLNVIEGCYSMHPALAGAYDLSIFLQISPQLQQKRIQRRETPEQAQRFFEQWVPLERRYFEQLDVLNRCDIVLPVGDRG